MAEYIDKQAVIDEVDEWYDLYPDSDTAREALSLLKKAIKKISTEDVRPTIDGNWIPVTNGRGGHECSRCHEYAPSYQAGSEYLSRFCPSCGCYMGEE